MGVNIDKPERWKADIARSVDLYNDWFMKFAPRAYRESRVRTAREVESTLKATDNLRNVQPEILRENPAVLPTLRMATCPPLARDRLSGLSGVPRALVNRLDKEHKLPAHMAASALKGELKKMGVVIEKLADHDLCVWLKRRTEPTAAELERAATVIADRLCGATADPLIRNAQEERQLKLIGNWLNARGYKAITAGSGIKFDAMPAGSYAFRFNVPALATNESERRVNIPVDVAIKSKNTSGRLPICVEAKSAGDFTNVNKRRKEEAQKMSQLRRTYGNKIKYILFLCGYFDSGYLGYEASEGIDWVWEHRIDDLAKFEL
ncbi:MAG: XamI family restriction endonuclease [Candidatus Binataceae bacterium]